MTLMGKLLVTVQLVLSVCFMAFAGAVFSQQSNWKAKAETTQKELEKEKANAENEKKSLQAQITEAGQKVTKAEERAKKAEGDYTTLVAKTTSLEEEKQRLNQDLGVKTNLAESAQTEANIRRNEAVILQGTNDTLNKDLNAKNAANRALEDDLFNTKIDLKNLTEKYEVMLRDMGVFTKVLAKNGFSTDPKSYGKVDAPAPQVYGRVIEVQPKAQGGRELVQISIGSDDAVQEGAELIVYRVGERAKFLAKIRIELVKPDAAVGSVIRDSKSGVIEKGDYVTTKL